MTMRRTVRQACVATVVAAAALPRVAPPARGELLPAARPRRTSMTAYDFEFISIDGDHLPMRQWEGRPVLVVNTASFCGFTPQYKALEALWRTYKDRGLALLGVPSNDFGEQEPGNAS